MAITADMIKELREKTGMGMTDCKKALTDANGNMDDAEMILRKKGLDKAAKKADRATGQGVIAVEVKDGVAVMVELQCEQEPTTNNDRFKALLKSIFEAAFASKASTPEAVLAASVGGETIAAQIQATIGVVGENLVLKHVARVETPAGGVLGCYAHFNKKAAAVCALKLEGATANDELKTVANDVCMHSVACRPMAVDRSGIPADMIAKEREVFMEEVSKKPAQIQEKIMEGKLSKFYGEKCLTEQIFVKDPDGKNTVQQVIDAAAKKAGGKATIAGFARMELGL